MRRIGEVIVGSLVLLALGAGVMFLGPSWAREQTAASNAATTPVSITTSPPRKQPSVPASLIPTAMAQKIRPYPVPLVTSIPLSTPPQPAVQASDPYQLWISGQVAWNRNVLLQDATVVAIGTVKEILPPRWNTGTGARPANPHVPRTYPLIYRPSVFEVEHYLKGPQPQRQLMLFNIGGMIDGDSVHWGIDDMFDFQAGQRMVVYLTTEQSIHGNEVVWKLQGRYTVDSDAQVHNTYEQLPLLQLVNEILQTTITTPTTAPAKTIRSAVSTPSPLPQSPTLGMPDLAPVTGQSPAAGICAHNTIPNFVVSIDFNIDTPSPRCWKVIASQRLQVTNRTSDTLDVKLARFTVHLARGQTYLFDAPFGSYLAPGVHSVWASSYPGSGGAELWLVPIDQPLVLR